MHKIAEGLLNNAEEQKQRVSPEQMRTALLTELQLVEPEAVPDLRKVDPIVTHWDAFWPGATLKDLLPDPKNPSLPVRGRVVRILGGRGATAGCM